MGDVRWIIAASYYPHLVHVRSHHEPDGTPIYEREVVDEGVKGWWIFHEIKPGDEELDADKVPEGATCGVFYRSGDHHVLACVYDHLPLAGYPRKYQACLDDLPTVVREKCWYEGSVLFFPEPTDLPEDARPVYGLLAAALPPHLNPVDTLR